MKRLNTDEVIKVIQDMCKERNYEFLGFVEGEYIGVQTHLKLKCNNCGNIWETTTFDNFRRGKGCKCNIFGHFKNKDKVIAQIRERCEKLNYTFIGFENDKWSGLKTHLIIQCNNCGFLWKTTRYCDFIYSKTECPNCNLIKQRIPIDIVLSNINNICKEKNYEFLGFIDGEYKGNQTKLILKCNNCGYIWKNTSYSSFLKGVNCKNCNIKKRYINEVDALKDIQLICKERNYEFLGYVNNEWIGRTTKLILKCNICGNIWSSTDYNHFVNGRGCPNCKTSKLELDFKTFLNNENILFERQKHFEWLGKQTLDFYLPQYNVAVECQGNQHFMEIKNWGGEKRFKKQQESDAKKLDLCTKKGVKVFYYSNLGIDYPYTVYEDKTELLKTIQNEK